MRHFNNTEKRIIDYICEASPLSQDIAITTLVTNVFKFTLIWDEKKLKIYGKDGESALEAANQVMDLICLLDYLSSEGLIYLFKRKNINSSGHIYNTKEGHCNFENIPSIKRNLVQDEGVEIQLPMGKFKVGKVEGYTALTHVDLPWDIVEKIDEYSASVFFCSESLRTIKKNDYKDDATIQYENTRCQTWLAIIVAMIGVIGGFLIDYFK
jgi:hypothetical protein